MPSSELPAVNLLEISMFIINFLINLIEPPIINVLVVFYHGLVYLHIPYALGFAIIALTVFIRLILYPLTASQLKMQKKMQDIAPHISKIKEKHKGDMKRQQEATMALYKEHNLNPAAGCLPAIVQIAILLFGLYPALRKVIALGSKDTVLTINKTVYSPALKLSQAWDTHFFGLPLAQTPANLWKTMPLILLIPIFTGLFQFIQSKMMVSAAKPDEKPIEAKKGQQEDFATSFQKQSLYLLPIMIGFFSYGFSIGLSLYWNTFTIFGIIQQYRVSGWGGLSGLFAKTNNNL